MRGDSTTGVLIIGSGAAGLSLALRLAEHTQVTILSKERLSAGSTFWAQGGVSAVLDANDSVDAHARDTEVAGVGLCDPAAVRFTVEHSRESIDWLTELGVEFTRNVGGDARSGFHLTREGGHSHRRVVHAADATGRAIHSTLAARVRDHLNVTVEEYCTALELLTARKLGFQEDRCLGCYVFNRERARVETIKARFVAIATGGASKAYLYSTNPDASTGDGIAMAWRAGCRVCNMEFMQFHPTCLHHPEARNFLISEAIRGEGGRLLLPSGDPFMERFDSRRELAPRDIVARAIDHEMKRLGISHVLLDITHKPSEFIKTHFPNIYERCYALGLDMTQEPLPVVPAAHYTCGGVMSDQQGRTDLRGLYCVGEAAYTGLHGANRMASNSLLECLVYSSGASRDIIDRLQHEERFDPELPAWDESRVTNSDEEVVVAHNWDELRRFMWDYVGIVRTSKRLQRAKHRVDLLRHEINEYYGNFRVGNDLIELRNLSLAADLIIQSATLRRESRGLHYTLDFPIPDSSRPPQNTVLVPRNYARLDERAGDW